MIQVAVHPTPQGYLTARTLPHARHIFGTQEKTWHSMDDSIRRATERLGPIAHMKQVHGNRVVYAHTSGLFEDCDALYTDQPDLWLAVKTADCVPVLISSPAAVAAIHAGWRGLENGIIDETIHTLCEEFALDPSDLHVAIGPCISQPHYEVEKHFENIFPERFCAPSEKQGCILLDLAGITRQQILQAGVLDIHCHALNRCTYEEADTFYSHRRFMQGKDPHLPENGRQLSLIRRS